MKTLTISIAKNFGKSVTIELPDGSRHIVTQAQFPGFYHALINHLEEKEKLSNTLILPDDYEIPEL